MINSDINSKFNLFLESLDMGIEPGMASNSFSKEFNRKKDGKVTIVPEDMSSGEMVSSISDQKEDELKKNGISLTSFKSKKFM